MAMVSEMCEVGPHLISHNVAISVCDGGDQQEQTCALLCGRRNTGMTADVISPNAAVSACEKGNQWEQALKLLHKIYATGMTDNVISLNAAISLVARGSKGGADATLK